MKKKKIGLQIMKFWSVNYQNPVCRLLESGLKITYIVYPKTSNHKVTKI